MPVEISPGVGFGNESLKWTNSYRDWKFNSTCEHVKEIQYASSYWKLFPLLLTHLCNFMYSYRNLQSNGLTGRLPPELGNLRYLQELWLDSNRLQGPIPASGTYSFASTMHGM